jgi:hypothetical protein
MSKEAAAEATPGAAHEPVFSTACQAEPVSWTVPSHVGPLAATDAGLSGPLVSPKAVSPRLRGELFSRLLSYGTPQATRAWT